MSGIRLSEQHGVNPSVGKCFYCQGDTNTLMLLGQLPDDAEAPRGMVWDLEPCDQCKGYMEQGVIVIGVEDGEYEKIEKDREFYKRQVDHLPYNKRDKARPFIPNPYRTGLWCVVKDRLIENLIETPELREQVLRCRWLFMENQIAEMTGFREFAEQLTEGEQDAS